MQYLASNAPIIPFSPMQCNAIRFDSILLIKKFNFLQLSFREDAVTFFYLATRFRALPVAINYHPH